MSVVSKVGSGDPHRTVKASQGVYCIFGVMVVEITSHFIIQLVVLYVGVQAPKSTS